MKDYRVKDERTGKEYVVTPILRVVRDVTHNKKYPENSVTEIVLQQLCENEKGESEWLNVPMFDKVATVSGELN